MVSISVFVLWVPLMEWNFGCLNIPHLGTKSQMPPLRFNPIHRVAVEIKGLSRRSQNVVRIYPAGSKNIFYEFEMKVCGNITS